MSPRMAKARHAGGIILGAMVIGFAAAWLLGGARPIAPPASTPALVLERTIPLGAVKGRIDHLAIDSGRKRLFVAELGNDTLAVVDLERGEVIKRIEGLHEPQGVGYLPNSDLVYVANAGDGAVQRFAGADLAPAGSFQLGADADNIRLDGSSRLVIGYGSGGLATVDAASGRTIDDITLPAHPEGFQIDPKRGRIYVNLPFNLEVASIDRSSGKRVGRWGLSLAIGNFPMALDEGGDRLFVGYRTPATLAMIDTRTGETIGTASICADADDLFYDERRKRVYASCGAGEVGIYDAAFGLSELESIATAPGARTSLFVPALDRLFVAVPEHQEHPAEVMVLAPR